MNFLEEISKLIDNIDFNKADEIKCQSFFNVDEEININKDLYKDPKYALISSTEENQIVYNKYMHSLYVYYKSSKFFHRYNGPAIIVVNTDSKVITSKSWYVNNKGIPHWVPKMENGMVYGKVNKKLICDVIFKYYRDYGNVLNKTYNQMKENKNSMQKELQNIILDIVKSQKETTIDKIGEVLFEEYRRTCIGDTDCLLDNSIQLNLAMKILEENVFELVINKSISYNEKSKSINILT